MRKILIILSILITSFCNGQMVNDRYEISDSAKIIISSLNLEEEDEIVSNLTSGVKVVLREKYSNFELLLISESDQTYIKTLDNSNNAILELYEYDFDNDGNKELIIVSSLKEFEWTTIEVFKYKDVYVKKIGGFEMGLSAEFNKNIISIYSGHRDAHINYIYFENNFWKLNWHDPNDIK